MAHHAAARTSHLAGLRRLADQVLEAADLPALARLLTRALPELLRVASATLLVWDRKLDAFQALNPGETHIRAVRPQDSAKSPPEARYMISDGRLLETRPDGGDGALLPLMARAGLAGMLLLGPRAGRRRVPYNPAEVRILSALAARAALAVENGFYQRELIASERITALGSMAGMLAHDLRGPMTVIRGYAETLLDGEHGADEVRERAQIIVDMVDKLERMTTDTLDFARGGGRMALRPVALKRQIDEWARGLGPQLPGLEVLRDVDLPDDVRVALDPDKLARALHNLAANSHEAMLGRGRLHVSARLAPAAAGHAQTWAEIDVRDEGPGVPLEIRERVFEPFVTQGKQHGTGLGLAVARRFVEDHGGSLELLPDGPGACFRIRLPLAERTEGRVATTRPGETTGSSGTASGCS